MAPFVEPTHPDRSFYKIFFGTVAAKTGQIDQEATVAIRGGLPANTASLFVDSDCNALDALKVTRSEKFQLQSGALKEIYVNRHAYPHFWKCIGPNAPKELSQWFAGHNPALAANGLRILGLALILANLPALKRKIEEDFHSLVTRTQRDEVEIHVVATGAGGTGSGGIISLIALLYLLLPKAHKFLHLYVTSRRTKDDAGRMGMNQLALLTELSAAMCGAYKPIDPTSRDAARQIDLTGALTGCFLTTPENNTGTVESLEYQQRLVAGRLLLKTVTFAKDMPDSILRTYTGQDRVDSFEKNK